MSEGAVQGDRHGPFRRHTRPLWFNSLEERILQNQFLSGRQNENSCHIFLVISHNLTVDRGLPFIKRGPEYPYGNPERT